MLWARAERQVSGWVLISLRMPPRLDGPVTFFIQEPVSWHPAPRSQLTLDPSTGAIVKWEPFAGQNLGRRLRSWVRPLHTGEAGGVPEAGGVGRCQRWLAGRAKKCQLTDTPRYARR